MLVDVDEDKLDAVVRAAKEAGGEIKSLVADVRTAEACRRPSEGVELVGTPEIFLHAVGRNERKPVLELGDEDWQDTLTLNLSTAYWLGPGRRAAHGRAPATAGWSSCPRSPGCSPTRTTRRTRRPRAA